MKFSKITETEVKDSEDVMYLGDWVTYDIDGKVYHIDTITFYRTTKTMVDLCNRDGKSIYVHVDEISAMDPDRCKEYPNLSTLHTMETKVNLGDEVVEQITKTKGIVDSICFTRAGTILISIIPRDAKLDKIKCTDADLKVTKVCKTEKTGPPTGGPFDKPSRDINVASWR